MRLMLLAPLLLAGACNVSTDEANDSVTLQYDENVAENTAAAVGNTAENIGQAIGNEAEDLGDEVSANDESSNAAAENHQ